jgi:membrane protein implicated in regulation of membrane protease activity
MTLNIISFCATNLLWLELSPTAFDNIHWRFYIVFICISVISTVLVYAFFPNTLQRPLEEIAQLFGDDITTLKNDNEEKPEYEVKHVEELSS